MQVRVQTPSVAVPEVSAPGPAHHPEARPLRRAWKKTAWTPVASVRCAEIVRVPVRAMVAGAEVTETTVGATRSAVGPVMVKLPVVALGGPSGIVWKLFAASAAIVFTW